LPLNVPPADVDRPAGDAGILWDAVRLVVGEGRVRNRHTAANQEQPPAQHLIDPVLYVEDEGVVGDRAVGQRRRRPGIEEETGAIGADASVRTGDIIGDK